VHSRTTKAAALALTSAAALSTWIACTEEDEPPSQATTQVQPPPTESPVVAAQSHAQRVAKLLGKQLKTRLLATMGEGGPTAAIAVCADEAQQIGRDLHAETGVRVGRASLKLRNPDNAGPPWVRSWLEQHGERAAEGVDGTSTVDEGNARVILPIAIEGVCLNCHGSIDQLDPAVRTAVEERYPDDQAVGYAEGDLRGALWAERSVQ
jgi:hypothetical protein